MKSIEPSILDQLWHDWDLREERLREIVEDRLKENPPPTLDDHLVATYFFALRTKSLTNIGSEISYHATSGMKDPPTGSLVSECTGHVVGSDAFDHSGRMGLLQMAYPLKMMRQPDGHLTSCDLLHTSAGAIIFDVYENQDSRLIDLRIPDEVVRTFPGPAYGPQQLRKCHGFSASEPAFGTILKPTAGITPDDVSRLVEEAARCDLLMFVKEDENLYPNLDYSPVQERTTRAVAAIERAREVRGDKGLVFAPHVTGTPHELIDTVHAVLDSGATGVMFSESFCGGTVRMVREATRDRETRPAIYGHNAGIGVRTRCIWREVVDLLARLDGIDFRQTAPVRPGPPFIRPYRAEWEASERVLTRDIPGIRPTMIARAGGLDQGNVILNLADAEQRGLTEAILLLAGSAINSIKNAHGVPDPRFGAEAMMQALEVHRSGDVGETTMNDHLAALWSVARQKGLTALAEALKQRYPGELL